MWEPGTRQAALDAIAIVEKRGWADAETAAQVATAYAILYIGDRLLQMLQADEKDSGD